MVVRWSWGSADVAESAEGVHALTELEASIKVVERGCTGEQIAIALAVLHLLPNCIVHDPLVRKHKSVTGTEDAADCAQPFHWCHCTRHSSWRFLRRGVLCVKLIGSQPHSGRISLANLLKLDVVVASASLSTRAAPM